MDTNSIYTVKNRSNATVVYSIPEKNVRREFMPGETKKISYGELESLSFQPGGRQLIQDYLQIQVEEVTQELGIKTEPEYYLDEQGVKDLLLTGSLDAFLDALDFAPDGVMNLIKKYSVDLPLTDYQKRKALLEKTGFDVDKAVRNTEDEKNHIDPIPAQRRVKPEAPAETGRRTTPKYNVVK